jgi:hypothetical protein
MAPGQVQEIDWFLKVDPPLYFCNSDFTSSIKISGTNGNNALIPPYIRPADGADTCEHPIAIACAETDTLPPKIDSLRATGDSIITFDVSDNRKTPIIDRGLKSITWKIQNGYPAGTEYKFDISMSPDPILACFNDSLFHKIVMKQKDSTVAACFDFKLIDCIGNEKDTTICFTAHIPPALKDTFPPRPTDSTTYTCDSQKRAVTAYEIRPNDRGVATIDSISGKGNNMKLTVTPFKVGDSHVKYYVSVVDSEYDGDMCVHLTDAATPPNTTDTCYHYCTTPDKLAPRIKINQVGTHSWDIEVHDDTAWDRRIKSIWVTGTTNYLTYTNGFTTPYAGAFNLPKYAFNISVPDADTTQSISFCVHADDRAGNVDSNCAGVGTQKDKLAPNIVPDKDLKTSPSDLTVTFNDIHFVSGVKYVWDTGLDSVWVTNNNGFVTSWGLVTGMKFTNCPDTTPPPYALRLTVTDTLAAIYNGGACIDVHARDCAGNDSVITICYPYANDTLPPLMKVQYVDKQNLQVTVTDNLLHDRGLGTILSSNEMNLQSVNTTLQRIPTDQFLDKRTNVDQSTTGTMSAIDYWGMQVASQALQHSAIAQIAVWVQDLAMHGVIATQNSSFSVPVYLVKNDAVLLDQKGIKNIKFSFTMNGTPSAVQFDSVGTQNHITGVKTPLATGWTINPWSQVGNTITISADALPGTVLKWGATDDTLMYLYFNSTANNSTVNVSLDPTPIIIPNGWSETIVYNNSADVTTNGLNSISIMPPPWGSMNGSNIVILGACTPSMTNFAKGSNIITLDEANPNPVSHSTLLHYTLTDENDVQIAIYDMLGRQVKLLVSGNTKPGSHDLPIDVSDIADGQYTIRMESAGSTVIRKILVQK